MKTLLPIIIMIMMAGAAAGEIIDCHNCTDCSQKIQNASGGDTVRLTEDITNCPGTCIDFAGADQITFDGGGHFIEGDEVISGHGVHLDTYSCNNIVTNATISNFRDGIYLFTSYYNDIRNITASNNRGTGMTMLYCFENTIQDCMFQENKYDDFYFRPNLIQDCDNTLINVTGSGDRPIGYYTSNVTLRDLEFASLYLCDADNSILDNITVEGAYMTSNNALRLYFTDNATLTNITSSDNFGGIFVEHSNDNTITRATCNNSHHYNIFVSQGNGNLIQDTISCDSSQCGIYLYHAFGTTLQNVTASYDPIGIRLDNSPSTVIKDSWIVGNRLNGISGGHSGGSRIYNNYFDNTDNVDSYFDATWNITAIPGTNIIGGPSIGGNYWNDYKGFPTSATGFGEQPHDTLCGIDYLPLVPVSYPQMYIRNAGYDLNISETWRYLVTCRNASGIDVECSILSWSSSNETVGTMDVANFTALAPGSTNISVFGFHNMTDTIVQNVTAAGWLCGDVDGNGHISANDCVEAYGRAVDPNYPLPNEWAADVDGNAYISANDVVQIYATAVNPDHPLNCI